MTESSDTGEIYDLPFPDNLAGEVIDGIDVQMVASDSLRIIDAFCKNGKLTDMQLSVLKEADSELEIIILNTEDLYKPYFGRIKQAVKNVLNQIKK